MQKITIIGTGNIAWHLARGIAASEDFEVAQLVGRSQEAPADFKEIATYTNQVEQLRQTDIIIIAVSDTAIAGIAKKLGNTRTLVVHTSGSMPMSLLDELPNYGVLYPLQTFTKGRPVDLKPVPFCIEANDAKNLEKVQKLASVFSRNVQQMDSKKRADVHFSAVLANNFSNHLLALTAFYCDAHALSFELLKPLLQETVNKAFDIGPVQAQTGPARRGDQETIQKQLAAIDDDQLKHTYILLTNSILKTYGKEEL